MLTVIISSPPFMSITKFQIIPILYSAAGILFVSLEIVESLVSFPFSDSLIPFSIFLSSSICYQYFCRTNPSGTFFLLFLPNWASDPPNTLFSPFFFSFACCSCDDLVISSTGFLLIWKADSSAMNLRELWENLLLSMLLPQKTVFKVNPVWK